MFLTNQPFPTSFAQPVKETVPPKTRHNTFTQLSGNLWNNKHRTSKKVSRFYHSQNERYKGNKNPFHAYGLCVETHLSDNQIQRLVDDEKRQK